MLVLSLLFTRCAASFCSGPTCPALPCHYIDIHYMDIHDIVSLLFTRILSGK